MATPMLSRRILGLAMVAMGLFALAAQPLRVKAQNKPVVRAVEAPQVENAKMQTQAVSASLSATIDDIARRAEAPVWVAYGVEGLAGRHSACCGNYSDGDRFCSKCRLEHTDGDSITTTHSDKNAKTLHLESAAQLFVLLRIAEKRVMKIHVASEDCVLDAGGLPFIWLSGAQPSESVALLSAYVTSGDFSEHGHGQLGNGALTAIALHGGTAADRAVESFAAPIQNEHLRKQAAFWLGSARGKSGLAVLERMAKSDPSPEVRAQVAFAFHCSKEPAAVDDMIHMAHQDESAHVRGQALFWLAQKAGQKAVSTIQGAIDADPDTEVKKKAVFALSQLPKDEGVPKLIEVAQNNRNPEVRKQAMFWLGQSHDPRALDFFEKILSR
jgi:HEAT repeat protein